MQTHYKGNRSSVCVHGKQQRIDSLHTNAMFKKGQHHHKVYNPPSLSQHECHLAKDQ